MNDNLEKNPQKKELEKAVPIPIVQIMNDLSQGYSLVYPLEGRMAKKYKVFKKLGDIRFEVVLLDHDIITADVGASLFIYRESETEKMDAFSVIGRRKGQIGSYSFSIEEMHSSRKPMYDFWEEYLKAEIDLVKKNKMIEQDKKLRETIVEINPPNLTLALQSSS